VEFVQLELFFPALQHDIFHDFLECQVAREWVRVVAELFVIVRVCLHAVDDVQKLNPLLFRGCAPTLKPAFIEASNDLLKRIFLGFALTITARVGVLRFEF